MPEPYPGRKARLAAVLVPIGLTLALALAYAGFGNLASLQALEGVTLNWRFHLRGAVAPTGEVAVVAIDDRAVAALGRWPLSRGDLADAVDRLAAARAKAIAFDLLLVDAAPGDERLARSIAAAGNVVLPFAFMYGTGANVQPGAQAALARGGFELVEYPNDGAPEPASPGAVVAPPAGLAATAASLGHVTLLLDPDGSLRFEHLALAHRGEAYPSLPLQAARVFLGLPASALAARWGEGIRLGDRFVPTDRGMRLPVDFYGPSGTIPTHSLADLLSGAAGPEAFAGRLVLVGATAVGIGGGFPTPFSQTLSGTEYLATVADNLIGRRILERRDRTVAIDLAGIVVAGLAAAWAATRLAPGPALAAALAIAAAWTGGAAFAFAKAGVWLAVVFPNLAIALNFLWGAGLRAWREQARRRQVERQRRNLSRYFSPAVAEALAERDTPFARNRVQEAAVLFVDIVGFTRLVRDLDPDEAIELLRRFHGIVEAAVFARDGTLDKYIGDGALATFGVPEPSPRDAADALRAAKAIALEVEAWGRELAAAGRPRIRAGLGIHHGPVLVGDIGGTRRFEFTVIGDTVNVASRLEGLTREVGVAVVASQAVLVRARAAGDAEAAAGFRPLPPRELRGRPGEVAICGWSPDPG